MTTCFTTFASAADGSCGTGVLLQTMQKIRLFIVHTQIPFYGPLAFCPGLPV